MTRHFNSYREAEDAYLKDRENDDLGSFGCKRISFLDYIDAVTKDTPTLSYDDIAWLKEIGVSV